MKRVGYVLLLLFGCVVIWLSIDLWRQREFAKSVEFFVLGLTFIVVLGDLLLTGRVRWLGRWLGSIPVHAPKDKDE